MVTENAPTNVSEPHEVAELVFTAGTDSKRKTMYTINNKFLYKVMARLPAWLVDRGVVKQLT